MLNLPPSVRIFVCVIPVDMRRSFDSLSGMVREYMSEDPQSGHLFLFRNRGESKIKVLYWDRDGFAIWYKRLERGTFGLPNNLANGLEIDASSLAMLLGGINLDVTKRQKRYESRRVEKREVQGVSV